MRQTIQMYTYIAFSTAIIAVLAQITIPLPLIPITGQSLAIALIATIMPIQITLFSVLLYVAIGALGIPVYANFTAGIGILFGPTGGFLFSFIVMALFISLYISKTSFTFLNCLIANMIGMLINLSLGTVWLKYYLSISFVDAFVTGFMPFIIVGIVKAFIACYAGIHIKNRLHKAKLLKFS